MSSRKIILVTGGNNGIGYETVKALLESQKPYHVLMGSRSVEKAKTAIEKLKAEVPETSNTVEILQVDLTSDESIEKAFEEVKRKHGYLDVLINNAGTSQYFVLTEKGGSVICEGKEKRNKADWSDNRCEFRPSVSRWEDESSRMLQQSLRRERHWNQCIDIHIHPTPPCLQINTASHLRSRSLRHDRRGKKLLPDPAPTSWLA